MGPSDCIQGKRRVKESASYLKILQVTGTGPVSGINAIIGTACLKAGTGDVLLESALSGPPSWYCRTSQPGVRRGHELDKYGDCRTGHPDSLFLCGLLSKEVLFCLLKHTPLAARGFPA